MPRGKAPASRTPTSRTSSTSSQRSQRSESSMTVQEVLMLMETRRQEERTEREEERRIFQQREDRMLEERRLEREAAQQEVLLLRQEREEEKRLEKLHQQEVLQRQQEHMQQLVQQLSARGPQMTFSLPQPQRFFGKEGKDNVEFNAWVQQVADYARETGRPALEVMQRCLDGPALVSYNAMHAESKRSFEVAVQCLRPLLKPVVTPTVAALKIKTDFVQGKKEQMSEYVERWNKQHAKIVDDKFFVRAAFLENLKPNIKKAMVKLLGSAHDDWSLAKVQEEAIHTEHAMDVNGELKNEDTTSQIPSKGNRGNSRGKGFGRPPITNAQGSNKNQDPVTVCAFCRIPGHSEDRCFHRNGISSRGGNGSGRGQGANRNAKRLRFNDVSSVEEINQKPQSQGAQEGKVNQDPVDDTYLTEAPEAKYAHVFPTDEGRPKLSEYGFVLSIGDKALKGNPIVVDSGADMPCIPKPVAEKLLEEGHLKTTPSTVSMYAAWGESKICPVVEALVSVQGGLKARSEFAVIEGHEDGEVLLSEKLAKELGICSLVWKKPPNTSQEESDTGMDKFMVQEEQMTEATYIRKVGKRSCSNLHEISLRVDGPDRTVMFEPDQRLSQHMPVMMVSVRQGGVKVPIDPVFQFHKGEVLGSIIPVHQPSNRRPPEPLKIAQVTQKKVGWQEELTLQESQAPDLTPEQITRLTNVLKKYSSVFASQRSDVIAGTLGVAHVIETEGPPIKKKPRKCSTKKKEVRVYDRGKRVGKEGKLASPYLGPYKVLKLDDHDVWYNNDKGKLVSQSRYNVIKAISSPGDEDAEEEDM